MNKTAVFFAAGLALLAGCVKDDLSWRALLSVEKQKQEELAEKVEGLQKSNTPFMLVMVDVPQDTVSKGVDFASLFRVNPSGVQLTKEMIALDCVSSKQFFPVQSQSSNTKASYVTPSEHFSIKELAVDKNAAGEPREGQYLATLTTSSEEIVWDDSRMAFVGAYVDHEGKTQCVSSDVFQTVMMPLPHEGMDLWMYPHASLIIKENQKDTLGSVYLPLDSKTFQMKGGGETRRYTSDMLFEASFALDEGCTAPVTLKFDDKRHFLRFTPDTTGNETWRALQDTTVLKRQDVTGILSLKDRWGGESSLHLKMSWYNVRQLALEYEVSAEDIQKGYPFDLAEPLKPYGIVQEEVLTCRRFTPFVGEDASEEGGLIEALFQDLKDLSKGTLRIMNETPVPGKTYSTRLLVTYFISVNEDDIRDTEATALLTVDINVTVKSDPVENLAEKLIGEWREEIIDDRFVPDNQMKWITVTSASEAWSSAPLNPDADPEIRWKGVKTELDVAIDGQVVTFKERNGDYSIRMKVEVIDDSEILFYPLEPGSTTPSTVAGISRWVKETSHEDYSQGFIKLWQCGSDSAGRWSEYDYLNVRFAPKADGSFVYYKRDENGLWKPMTNRTECQYVLYGNSLGTRWKEDGKMVYEWWLFREYESGMMLWDSYRQKPDGKSGSQNLVWKEVIFPTQAEVEEKIIGKWASYRMNTKALPTDETSVITFQSISKATVSASMTARTATDPVWDYKKEVDVSISENVITVTNKIDEHKSVVTKMTVTGIEGDLMDCILQMTDYVDDQAVETHPEINMQYKRIDQAFEQDILGVWEGKSQGSQDTYGDGKPHRWEFKADGTYVYYVQDGNKWTPGSNTLNEYFVDGDKLCMRWKDGGKEYREWWTISSLANNEMTWTAVRKDETGTYFTPSYALKRINQ